MLVCAGAVTKACAPAGITDASSTAATTRDIVTDMLRGCNNLCSLDCTLEQQLFFRGSW